MIIEIPRVFVCKHITPPEWVAASDDTEAKGGDATSSYGRLRYRYRSYRVGIFIAFRGVKHVELTIARTATSDNDQCDDRDNHEGDSSKDDSEDDHSDMGATRWCAPAASALGWYRSLGTA